MTNTSSVTIKGIRANYYEFVPHATAASYVRSEPRKENIKKIGMNDFLYILILLIVSPNTLELDGRVCTNIIIYDNTSPSYGDST